MNGSLDIIIYVTLIPVMFNYEIWDKYKKDLSGINEIQTDSRLSEIYTINKQMPTIQVSK